MEPSAAFGPTGGAYRRPLVLLSYAAQDELGVASPAGLHAANALVHAANAGLAVLVLVALGASPLVALSAALMFACHPLASGSVAYISGRTDLLATFFTLVAAWACARSSSAASLTVALAAVVAAALSKESGLAAGLLAASILWWRRAGGDAGGRPGRVALLLAATAVLAPVVMPQAAASAVTLDLRLRAVGTALATFTGLLVWPAGLHLDRLTPTGPASAAVLGGAAVALAAVAAWRFVRRPSRGGLLAVALVLLCAPGSGLVPVYPAIADRFVFTGEQFLYAPLVAIAAAAAVACHLAADALVARSPAATGLAARIEWPSAWSATPGGLVTLVLAMTLAIAWMPMVLERQQEFASAERVYRTTLAHSPSPRACFNLGGVMLARHDYEAARSVYEDCIAMTPGDAGAHGQLALALQQLGRADDARREYERSLELDGRNARVWSNFATLDANAGRYHEARAKWEKALAIDPGEDTARAALERLEAAGR